ncbi:MAG: IS3 family transposase, partial [Syntrophobacterales bacterium]|nr:IS3 family transposase [Syntrophobacterales bacterium]
MLRSRYYSFNKKRESKKKGRIPQWQLLSKIQQIKTEHPFWGYRRVTAWLRHREGIPVNHKTVRKIMKENGLTVIQKIHKAKRDAKTKKLKAHRPKQIWGIDMTKFMIPSTGWIYLVLVLDWYTKKIVGHEVSIRGRT